MEGESGEPEEYLIVRPAQSSTMLSAAIVIAVAGQSMFNTSLVSAVIVAPQSNFNGVSTPCPESMMVPIEIVGVGEGVGGGGDGEGDESATQTSCNVSQCCPDGQGSLCAQLKQLL